MVYLPAGHSQFTTHSTLFLYMSLCFSSHFTSSVCSTTEEDTLWHIRCKFTRICAQPSNDTIFFWKPPTHPHPFGINLHNLFIQNKSTSSKSTHHFPLPFFSFSFSLSFCDARGRAGASKVACNGKIPAAALGCPSLPAILYMSPGLLEGALMGALLARDLSLHTHAHLACTYMHIHKSHRCLTHAYTSKEG